MRTSQRSYVPALDPRDAEARAELSARKAQRDAEWLKGLLKGHDAIYTAGLMALGYNRGEAQAELMGLKHQHYNQEKNCYE